MCGIAGVIDLQNNQIKDEQISKMLGLIKHRGPDDEGLFIEKNVGLGFVRLSIIDLTSAGHQPKLSDDERFVIIFNGEIFNYIELREELEREGVKFKTKTDTEVLLNSFIFWGEKCLHKFNGMWAFAIYDRHKNEFFAARDRFGVKPFYYTHNNKFFAFCSEIPPLFSFLSEGVKPNTQSIFDYLVFNRTDQTDNTFFNEIKKLQHGHLVKISNGAIVMEKWYDLKEAVKRSEGFRNKEEFKDFFNSSIDIRLRSDVPVGICLSGGLDSSSIASTLIKEFKVENLNTFSAVYKKGQEGDEKEFIDEYTHLIKNMHYVTPTAQSLMQDLKHFIKIHAEPIPSTSPYAQYKVMELAKGNVVVTLDGQGADEHLAGYHYFFGFYFKDLFINFKFYTLIKEIIYYLKIHKSLFGIKSFIYFLLPSSLRTKVRINEKKYIINEFALKHKDYDAVSGNIYASKNLETSLLDHFEYKLEHLLKWADRNSMCFSLEARTPFLDYRLVERSLATKSTMKIKNGTTKFILREAMKGILPEKIRMRQDKIGFGTPQDEWFKEPEWKKMIYEILNSESFSQRKIIDPKIAKSQYEKHLNGEINIAKEIWKWIHLELWFREFIDNNKK